MLIFERINCDGKLTVDSDENLSLYFYISGNSLWFFQKKVCGMINVGTQPPRLKAPILILSSTYLPNQNNSNGLFQIVKHLFHPGNSLPDFL
jgi:hypothetical protein